MCANAFPPRCPPHADLLRRTLVYKNKKMLYTLRSLKSLGNMRMCFSERLTTKWKKKEGCMTWQQGSWGHLWRPSSKTFAQPKIEKSFPKTRSPCWNNQPVLQWGQLLLLWTASKDAAVMISFPGQSILTFQTPPMRPGQQYMLRLTLVLTKCCSRKAKLSSKTW